ncbi:hypothetical protein ABB02_00540 [Clostridiaceae bacterium JG1575]|nr:hypothetical protein ABB02_00540 [Clostridiaceae bacterium JG1575]
MQTTDPQQAKVMLTIIANWLMGDRVLGLASLHTINDAWIYPAKGTVRKSILRTMGLSDYRKDLVTIRTTRQSARRILEDLKAELNLEGPHSGIAWMQAVVDEWPPAGKGKAPKHSLGQNEASGTEKGELMKEENQQSVAFRAIQVLVRKGYAEDVILVGERSGTQGATVIPVRGKVVEGSVPGMQGRDEEEMVLVITSEEKAKVFIQNLQETPELIAKGRVRLYVTEIMESVGINYY